MPPLSAETLLSLTGFAFAALWTPGPNNFMLAASGATYGLKRTVPHLLGVALGFPAMLFAVTLGLGEVFRTEPVLRATLGWIGVCVMILLAVRIALQRGGEGAGAKGRGPKPLSFPAAAAFQWVNPKAWFLCIAVAATFASGTSPFAEATIASIVFALVGLMSATAWTAGGAAMRRVLGTGWRLGAFNITMAALLAGSAIALVLGSDPATP